MKSLKYILSIGVLASILLGVNTSCTIETDSSKKLGGFWHLESIDTLATGGHGFERQTSLLVSSKSLAGGCRQGQIGKCVLYL